MSALAPVPTQKQRDRLAEIESRDLPIRVKGWDDNRRGPIICFANGTCWVITRDGGLDPL